MKLGVFDSGLGGLYIAKAICEKMPDLDVLYYGDTLHVPYGNRSAEAIYYYTRAAVDRMFHQGCCLIVLACNTASAFALRRLQQEYLPQNWPGRNILGVVVPTLEELTAHGEKNIGILATSATVRSGIYAQELAKLRPDMNVQMVAAPLLVPMIENAEGQMWLQDALRYYIDQFEGDLDGLALGCTHYTRLRSIFSELNFEFNLFYQDIVIAEKLFLYLSRHLEYLDQIKRTGNCEYFVSDLADGYNQICSYVLGYDISLKVLK